jgi:hypothetical protein
VTSDARIFFFSFLPNGFSNEKKLCVRGPSLEPCTSGVAKEKGPLAKAEVPLLIGAKKRASPQLGFGLLLNLPKPCRELHPAFQILSATRRNSLSLEI